MSGDELEGKADNECISFPSDATYVLAELRSLRTLATLMTLKGPCEKGFWVLEPEAQRNGSPGSNCFSPLPALMDRPHAKQSIVFFFPAAER